MEELSHNVLILIEKYVSRNAKAFIVTVKDNMFFWNVFLEINSKNSIKNDKYE